MRQRVMIAMALALRPQLMIMDEPTTALDVLVQREILQQISDLRRELGFSVVFITHDLPLLLEISDRIAIMRAGRVVELDTAENIYRHAQHPYTRRLLGSFPSLTGERGDFVRTGAARDEDR
jgi:peptide/nickel transport system ATP-binding protein